MTNHRYYVLDAWRGIAAICIVLFHGLGRFGLEKDSFLDSSYLFVDLFFVLSGFVIAYNYHDKIFSDDISVKDFMIRRFLRIWPLHFLMLSLMAAGQFYLHDSFSVSDFLRHLFLLQSVIYPDDHTILNGVSWSISVEFYTYLIFAAIITRLSSNILFIYAIALCLMIALLNDSMNTIGQFDLPRCLAGFIMGVILFRATRIIPVHYKQNIVILTIIEMISVLGLIVFFIKAGKTEWSAIAPFFFFFFVGVFSLQSGVISKILSIWPFQFLGSISYSIYMTHIFVFSVLYHILPQGMESFMIAIALVIMLSTITYEFVEKTFYQVRRR